MAVRRGVVVLGVVAIAAGVLTGGALALRAGLEPALRSRIVAEARARGIVIDFDEAVLWPGHARLDGVRFSLVGVPGLSGTARSMDVQLTGLTPVSVDAEHVVVSVVGAVGPTSVALLAWTRDHPATLRSALTARDVAATWKTSAADAPWIDVAGATLSARPQGGVRADSPRTTVMGQSLGAVGGAWTSDSATVAVGLGEPDLERAPLRVEVAHAAPAPEATLTLAPTALSKLPSAPKIGGDPKLSGTLVVSLPRTPSTESVAGSVRGTLAGWTPPKPKELAGISFGEATTFSANLGVDAGWDHAALSKLNVTLGSLKLDGTGDLRRVIDHATVSVTLDGRLACTEVARSAAGAQFGGTLGSLLGNLGSAAVEGNVGLRVKVEADTRDLAHATVTPTASIGCKVKGLSSLPALPNLPLPLPFQLPLP